LWFGFDAKNTRLNKYEVSRLKLRGDTVDRTEESESLHDPPQDVLEQSLDNIFYIDQNVQRQ
ncbi:MAG: hypothetical protein M3Z87_19795, partial [Lactobacillus sp.]|nr:hypothetical protein [Lactobacillus sp.]